MIILTVNDLHKYFGELHVLRGLSFTLNSSERVGIVGENGSGKTTLFHLLCSRLEPDQGSIAFDRGVRIGQLAQLPDYPEGMSVREVLWQAFAPIEAMGEELRALEEQMADGAEVDMRRYASLQTAYETAGGYDLTVPYRMMTNGLGIPAEMQDRPFSSLSGGEKTRIGLAQVMLSSPDVLLLDEPTNHLDLDSIEWLEEYLLTFKGAVMIISHDRYFLDRVATRILELEDGKMTAYPGNYSAYVDRKQEMLEQQEQAKERQDKEIARLSFTVQRMRGWGLGNKKVMKRALSMEKRLNRIERIEAVHRTRKMKGRITVGTLSGDDVLFLDNLAVGYDTALVSDITMHVTRGERVAILGANGAGKTTLMNTLLGSLPRLGGQIEWGTGVKPGYLPQLVSFDHPERNLLDTMLYETKSDVQQARDRLAAFQFTGEEVFKPVHVLSGGEKTRLKLCIFMNTQVNTLFLDEPTNHLDILSREWMEEAIDDFSETMFFISHDRYFISRLATRIWQVEEGGIRDFLGGFEEFRAHQSRMAQIAKPAPAKEEKRKPERPEKQNTKQLEKLRRELKRSITALEEELAAIEQEMQAHPDDYAALQELSDKKEKLEEELLSQYEQYEEG